MAEALLIQPALAIVNQVVSRVITEFKLPWVSQNDLEKVKNKLVYLQAFLHDAGSRKYAEKGALFNLWLKKVTDVAYYVEDILDEYAYDRLQKEVENKSRFKRYCSFFEISGSNPIAFNIRMAKKFNEAMSLFEEIYKEAKDLGIRPMELAENERSLLTLAIEEFKEEREFASYIFGFVGRQHDESEIVKMLLDPSSENSISVVAIVGIGGLGKTTLARRVYDCGAVREHFTKKVWICVSESFSVKKLLNEVAIKCGATSIEGTERALQKELEGQRYLLVLDDVWNTDQGRWESLMSSLYRIGGSLGSMILVTTRSHEVLETMQAPAVHTLQRLSEEESWALFERIVFRNETCDTSDLAVIGRKIVEKGKGVPLAIKMLGGLLRANKTAWKWKLIEHSEIWELELRQDRFGILPSLLLSFYYLPLPVKQCFSYCAIFPKDTVMSRNDLIRLWHAQGLLHQPSRSISAEDIGEEYFNMMLSNSLLEFHGQGYLCADIKCTMHDLVHDMAMFVFRNDCLIWKEENVIDDASMVRHLAFLGENLEVVSEFVANKKLSKLRTVHSQISITNNLLINASHLRVLKLSGIDLKEIPATIGHLKHCRYLNLSGNAFKSLPDSITKLYNLQTLQLESCPLLQKFPEGMSKLVNLRHIQTNRFMDMPAGMKSLTHLRTLPLLSLQDVGGGTIDEIGCLHDVGGILYIEGLECVASKEAAMQANLVKKETIVALGLRWSTIKDGRTSFDLESYSNYGLPGNIRRTKGGSIDEDVLDSLRPHPNLKRLEVIDYEGEKFPSWLVRMTIVDEMGREASLNHLVDIFLINCKKCEKLPTLGQLPCLRQLHIESMKSLNHVGIQFYVYSEHSGDSGGNVGKCGGRDMLFFPALITLHLIQLPALTKWLPPPKGATLPFPCLSDLRVSNCPRLITTPTQFPCLETLSIESVGSSLPLAIITNNIRSLRSVRLSYLSCVACMPEELQDCKNLKVLMISTFDRLVGLAEALQNLVSLRILILMHCSSLTSLPIFDQFKCLQTLTIKDCNGLSRIPSGLDRCPSLNGLHISSCNNIESFPSLRPLTNLLSLTVVNCKRLTSLPEGLECLHSLSHLNIGGLHEELEYFPDVGQLVDLKLLTNLSVTGWPKLKSLPDQLGLLTRLKMLSIKRFAVVDVPDWIGNLSSLDALDLWRCPNLECLPSRTTMLQLKRLKHITITDCPHMIKNYAEDVGLEWHKISHISYVKFS